MYETWLSYGHRSRLHCVCDTWLSHMWEKTHSYVRHDSFTCKTRITHTWDMTQSCMRHDSFMGRVSLCVWHMTHSYLKHAEFIYETWRIHTPHTNHSYMGHVTYLIQMWHTTNSDVRYDSLLAHQRRQGIIMCVCIIVCVWHFSPVCVCDITRLYVCVTLLVYMCMWHYSSVCVCDIPHLYVCVTFLVYMRAWHSVPVCVCNITRLYVCVIFLVCMCMWHYSFVCVWNYSFKCVACYIGMYDITPSDRISKQWHCIRLSHSPCLSLYGTTRLNVWHVLKCETYVMKYFVIYEATFKCET